MGGLDGRNDAGRPKPSEVVWMNDLRMLHAPTTVVGPAEDPFVGSQHEARSRIPDGVGGGLKAVGMDPRELRLVFFEGLQDQTPVTRPVVVRLKQGCPTRTKRAVHVEFEGLRHETFGAPPSPLCHVREVVFCRIGHGHDAQTQVTGGVKGIQQGDVFHLKAGIGDGGQAGGDEVSLSHS